MENSQFDAALGGTEHLPHQANSLKFATCRSVEISAMTESLLHPNKTKLIFQSLPIHMRRRVMSHNCKRLPLKLRQGHLEQLKKSGLPPKQKRPSRKYRRRPANLLEEYNRRQRQHAWLETHIWHAKRFHMIERWGYRLAYAPCDKAFRACYRATSAHCLLQDLSYFTPILISGPSNIIKDTFSKISSSLCGLGVAAKAYLPGNREGSVHLFRPNQYPFGYVGKVTFLWEPNTEQNRKLWLFAHPAQAKQIHAILTDITVMAGNDEDSFILAEKRRKLDNQSNKPFQVKMLHGMFNRFSLTGPKSHAVLVQTLKCIDNIDKCNSSKWITQFHEQIKRSNLEEKCKFWNEISLATSPSQLPQSLVLGLIVRDPRLSRPNKRSKATQDESMSMNIDSLVNIPACASDTPIYDTDLHKSIKENMLSNHQFIKHITGSQLVPGEVFVEDPALQTVPIVLIQRPGSQDASIKRIGYGCGWDVILPPGYGLPFWQTFIMFGARAGGLRETESLAFEMGECYIPPDSEAGKNEQRRIEVQLRDNYFKKPPSKRVNYAKLGICSPFTPRWDILLQDWSAEKVEKLYVLRDKRLLDHLQECLQKKSNLPTLENASQCLVPIYVQMVKRGNLKRHALICLPRAADKCNNDLVEPQHADDNEASRKELKKDHLKKVKQLRRMKIKMKKKGVKINPVKKCQKIKPPSDYVMQMRELWVSTKIDSVRHKCVREVMGYLSQGAFSFSEAKSCGLGYIAYNSLVELSKTKLNFVLVRNTSSRKYWPAMFSLIK